MGDHREKGLSAAFDGVCAITFDVGGTLIAPHPSVGAVYAEVLAAHGFPADADTLEADFRAAFRQRTESGCLSDRAFWEGVFRQACASANIPDNQLQPIFEAAFATFAEGRRWRVLDDVVATLAALRQRGLRLAVLSNSDSRFRTVLADLALAGYFDAFFLSEEIGWEKPDPRLFRHVQARLGLRPCQILHVGDSRSADYEGATAAGWHACLLDPPHSCLGTLRDALPARAKCPSQS